MSDLNATVFEFDLLEDFWLSRFVVEMRKQNGEEYPPKSIYLVMCGLLRYLRDNGVYGSNFLDNNNDQFSELRKVLDAQMKNLLKKGIGIDSKTADPILPEEENKLWTSGSLGNSNAKTLQHTVFYYACKLFGLRGFDEHRSLECTQFSVGYDERGKSIHFLGKNNKTFQGGSASMKVSNKNIKHYCDEGPRCVADYFQQYIQAINHGTFYRRPLAGLPIRYGEQPVGVNTLKTFMKSICEKAGLKGNFTNHSGKKTCATALYDAGVDEQEIMGRTGHRSEMAVRKYKRATPNVQQRTSNALNPPIQDIRPTPCDEECTENKQTKHGLQALSDITNTGTTFHGYTFNFKS